MIRKIAAEHIEGWAADLMARGYTPTTVRRKMVALRVFFSYWVRKGVLHENPFWRVRLSYGRTKQLPRTLDKEEIRGLLRSAKQAHVDTRTSRTAGNSSRPSSETYRTLRNLAMVELLFATGIRVGELSALDVGNYRSADHSLKIKGKGGRERLAIMVDSEAVSIFSEYLEMRNRVETESTALFVNYRGGRLSCQGIANVVSKLKEGEGLERRVTPHMLRHTVATFLLRNGLDIRLVQEFLGHASIATTQRYTHVDKEHLTRELRRRHPSLSLRTQ
jgi:integrase/recombinase XerD